MRDHQATALAPLGVATKAGDELAQLHKALDLATLHAHGWDLERQVFEPAAGDLYFGYSVCIVRDCPLAAYRSDLCAACATRLRKSGMEREVFVATPRPPVDLEARGPDLCLVCRAPGHERPASGPHGLCETCSQQQSWRGQTVEAYIAGDDKWPAATPRKSFGRCLRRGCNRWAARKALRLCVRCIEDWRDADKPKVERWRSSTPLARFGGGRLVDLSAHPERLRVELLLGIQAYRRREATLSCNTIQQVALRLLAHGFGSVLELPQAEGKDDDDRYLASCQRATRLALSDLASELQKDVWDVEALGYDPDDRRTYRRRLRFDRISQPWLRETAKEWAATEFHVSLSRTAEKVLAVERLSASLSLRRDGGNDPAALARTDLTQFLMQLHHLERSEQISNETRCSTIYRLRLVLGAARDLGLTGPGKPMHGLPDDFAIRPMDIPPAVKSRREGTDRALPYVVMEQLLAPAALERLNQMHGAAAGDCVELQAWVGRRTSEACGLPLLCLEVDDDQGAWLVYTGGKPAQKDIRVPLHADAAAIIRRQQQRVRAAFPGTPPEELKLFPRERRNPRGVHPLPPQRLADYVRTWVAALPELTGPDGEPFPRNRVYPYAFRHTFAQRHADAGTAVDVLADLLVHDQLNTTQGYYTVPEQRKKMAAAAMGPLTFNRSAELRGSPTLDALLHRQEIGRIPIPMGHCTEPSNVRAHGQACKYRYQCLACDHFRTDPSHLEDLREHLHRLLKDQQELAADLPALASWAHNRIMPHEDEIKALKQLISSIKAKLEELPADQRQVVLDSVRELRKLRASARQATLDQTALQVKVVAPTINPAAEDQHVAA